jgi:hypothetical protein
MALVKKLNDRTDAPGGSTPTAVAPPDCDNSKQVIRNYRIERRGGLGDRHCPFFFHQIFEFHISPDGILQSGNYGFRESSPKSFKPSGNFW